MSHPTELELERHLLDPATSAVAGHVAGCADCAAVLQRFEAEGRRFHQYVYPRTLPLVLERAARPRRLLAFALPALAVAAALALVVLRADPQVPPDDYVGLKGGGLSLTVFTHDAQSTRELPDGAPVDPRAPLRFRVRVAAPCRLFLVSVDASGGVSQLVPPPGDQAGLLVSGSLALPGGAELDGQAGPERFFALCAPEGALTAADLERAARAVGPGADLVRATQKLALPASVTQGTVLLEKRR